jgi:hypothetical protein
VRLFMCINPNPLPKIIIVYGPSNFLLSVSKPQSLNTCKSVGVKSHIVIESMGLSKINIKECESQHEWEKWKFKWVW